MNWSDSALLLGASRSGENLLALDLLTARHGRCQAMMDLSGRSGMRLLPGSAVRISYTSGGIDEPGRVELDEIGLGIAIDGRHRIGLVVVRTVTELLGATIGLREPVPEVHGAASDLFATLAAKDERWPVDYVRCEMAVLHALGQTREIERRRAAFRHGAAIYLSPRSGRVYTHEEAGAFVDRLTPVPGFLLGKHDAQIHHVRQGLDLTGLLFGRYAARIAADSVLPASRGEVVTAIGRLKRIPSSDIEKPDLLSDERRKQLLLSLRPLTIPGRSSLRPSA